ncbi:MAG: hypothetical protein ABI687_07890, partial [Flavitalea sp.]
MSIASYIDHTILKPATSTGDIKTICSEAIEYGFAAVCIPPPFVRNAGQLLKESKIKIATVAGFPLGYSIARAKLVEVQQAMQDGAFAQNGIIRPIGPAIFIFAGGTHATMESFRNRALELPGA